MNDSDLDLTLAVLFLEIDNEHPLLETESLSPTEITVWSRLDRSTVRVRIVGPKVLVMDSVRDDVFHQLDLAHPDAIDDLMGAINKEIGL